MNTESPLSDPRLLELTKLPLQQRAARIAELFSEGFDDQGPPAPTRLQRRAARRKMLAERPAAWLGRNLRALRHWMEPRRASRLLRNLGLFAVQALLPAKLLPSLRSRPDGFSGRAGSLAPNDLIEVFWRGMTPRALLGLTVLWSPPWRAVLRPEDFPRSLGEAPSEAHRIGVDKCFDGILSLCAERLPAHERKLSLDMALGDLYDTGFAHSLEVCDRHGRLIAGLIGVAGGGIFTVERIFADDPDAFVRGVNALAAQLKRWNFALIDFKEPSMVSDLLMCGKMTREAFGAVAATQACGGRHGRWRLDADLRAPPRRAAAQALQMLARAQAFARVSEGDDVARDDNAA
jgi:leucyl/phenylalanyl-tRNA--protein transferase